MVATAGEAEAQELRDRSALMFSADRLVPLFSYTRISETETQNNTTTTTATNLSALSFLWGQGLSVHTVPRAAFDFKLPFGLTVGGSVALAFGLGGSSEVKTTQGGTTTTTERDAPKSTVFGLAPRAGYMLFLTDRIIFWPRGGFGLYSVSTRSETLQGNNQVRVTRTAGDTVFSIDLDPQFAFVPFDNFFFNVGPLLNIPIAGSRKTEVVNGPVTTSQSDDLSVLHFGISAGLGGYLPL